LIIGNDLICGGSSQKYNMRLVIQRVKKASVEVDQEVVGSINEGLMVLIGIEEDDSHSDADYLVAKLIGMRIFSDSERKMNLSVSDIRGGILLVSQFTLHALTAKGNRPSFIRAARPEQAIPLYEYFIEQTKIQSSLTIQTGKFGADMQINMTGDGPVTIVMDSKNK
jgi:D-tyrosyl-tRNA(Tyr) deacylase